MEQEVVYANIARCSPADGESEIVRYEVPHARAMTGMSMLRYIQQNLDATLAFRDYRCGRGICNTCRVKVNGRVERMCELPVLPGREVLLQPASSRVIRDLVIDLS